VDCQHYIMYMYNACFIDLFVLQASLLTRPVRRRMVSDLECLGTENIYALESQS